MKFFSLFLFSTAFLLAQTITGKVVGISDGDTLTILGNSKQTYKIRLAQIDAPEKKQDFGMTSKSSLSDICFGKEAKAEVETIDRYKRYVAVVTCNGIEANLLQVKNGMAWVYTQYAKDKKYFDAEHIARVSKVGLWEQNSPIPPWEFRKLKKDFHARDRSTLRNLYM